MDLMDRPASGSEEPGPQAGRDKLAEHIARAVREDGTVEPLEGLHLARASSPTGSVHGVSTAYARRSTAAGSRHGGCRRISRSGAGDRPTRPVAVRT